MRHRYRDIIIRDCILAATAMGLIVTGAVLLAPVPMPARDVGMGLLVATVNGVAAAIINARAIGHGDKAFMIWTLAGHGGRMTLLLTAIFLAPAYGVTNFTVFCSVTLVGYFCFLTAEIATLNQRQLET